jgi:hypothetical protein
VNKLTIAIDYDDTYTADPLFWNKVIELAKDHGSHKGSYMLYGHVHGKFNNEDKASNKLTLDVGVDNTVNYNKPFGQPWSFKELQKLFNQRLGDVR